MGGVNKRKGIVTGTEAADEYFTVYADVSILQNVFCVFFHPLLRVVLLII